ncbi:MAG: ThuA domain-containing protein [Akkermansiaceae bacterium]
MMKIVILTIFASLALPLASAEPLNVFIRAGKKTHGPGAHDHPRFLADWSKLLKERGAEVDGALVFPTDDQMKKADVIVFYAANAGSMKPEERSALARFRKRGGGLVFIHDAVCGNDAQWFKGVAGGAWEHKHSRFFEGHFDLEYTKKAHPVTKGAGNFELDDEIYWNLHFDPKAKVLAKTNCKHAPGSPQIWSLETGKSRTFSSIPGHWHTTFSIPHYRAILLRGIAWAGHRNADLLTTPEEVKALEKPDNAIKLSGFVKNPGLVPYKRGMTLQQAIAAAGGRKNLAANTVYLRRNGKRYKFNLRNPHHQDLKVYPKDELDIPKSNW